MNEPTCPNCKEPMPPDAEVCPQCSEKGVPQYSPERVDGEKGLFYCYRHKRERTRLRCGRCARAICTDCALIGPAGPRCPDCGRSKVPIRARAVVHGAKVAGRNLVGGPMRFLGILIILGLVFTMVRGCRSLLSEPPPPEPEFETPVEPGEST